MQGSEPNWPALIGAETYSKSSLLHVGADRHMVADRCGGHAVYLATPYSKEVLDRSGNWSLALSLEASKRASREAVRLAAIGVTAVSPIVLAHEMVSMASFDPLDQKFWTQWCRPILNACGAVVVPNIQGWDASHGIWHEVTVALTSNRPVFVYAAGVVA